MEQPDRLAALRAGNTEAIRGWAGQYAPKVRDVGLAYLGGSQEAAALVKQVLEQALKAIQGGYSPMDMEEWLLGLARAQGSQAALSRPAQPLPAQSPHPILRAPASVAPSASPAQPEEPEEAPDPIQAEEPPVAVPIPDPEPIVFDRKEALSARQQEQPLPILLYDEEEEDSPFADEPLFRRRAPIKAFLGGMLILILMLVIAALVWGLAGLLMRLGILPLHDLGYTWFNANIYPFF